MSLIETREHLERPGALRRAVAEVGALAVALAGECVAADRAAAVRRLREIAAPDALDLLFRLALLTSLRRGPEGVGEVGAPAGLIDLCAAAAAAGALPLSNVSTLRDSLASLGDELHRSGAWSPDAPFWWSPLPPPGPLESAWRKLGDEGRLALPRPVGEHGWVTRPDALVDDLRRRIAAELDALAQVGRVAGDEPGGVGHGLGLREAGVGQADRRSTRRSADVRYLTGLEPDLLARAPTLAVLVQRLLEDVESELTGVLPEGAAFAPQTAMLARYPAPSDGFAAHLDNPGGDHDNGRTYALVLYLNPEGRPSRGGGLALWRPGDSTEGPPAAVLPPTGGGAVLFDARRVPHAVEPLAPGPERWTLVLWLSDRPRRPSLPLMPVPEPSPAVALLPLDDPPVAAGTVIFRRVARGGAPGPGEEPVIVRAEPARRPRVGFVTTAREPGPALDAWCRHHLGLGASHLLVMLDGDGVEGDSVGGDGVGIGDDRVTVWTREEAYRRRAELTSDAGDAEDAEAAEAAEIARLRVLAAHGRATWAVAARQALNASAGLRAAAAGELGGEPIDWLVHLDADELFHPEGAGRGGAGLESHFAAVASAGWRAVRYLNHELLLPWSPGEPARFKRNPAIATARLGPVGWARLARFLGVEQDGPRPWFRAYWNGKGAVSVAAAAGAAGVHGWRLVREDGDETRETLLAGPSILHYHLPTAASFRAKYREALLERAGDETGDGDTLRPFPPSRLEREAAALLREARRAGVDAVEVSERLDRLYAETSFFSASEIELLEEAGLLFTPGVEHAPLPGGDDRPAVRPPVSSSTP